MSNLKSDHEIIKELMRDLKTARAFAYLFAALIAFILLILTGDTLCR